MTKFTSFDKADNVSFLLAALFQSLDYEMNLLLILRNITMFSSLYVSYNLTSDGFPVERSGPHGPLVTYTFLYG